MTDRNQATELLAQWSPRLFLLGGAFELVFAVNNGAAFLLTGFSFVDWLYPTVLFGRVAVLLGIAGISVRLVNRNPRVGKWSQGILGLTLAFTIGLLSLSVLQIFGVSTPVIAIFGLGTVALTIVTYALFGGVIIRTEVVSRTIGSLLLAAAVTVLGVFVGLNFLPTRLIGGIGEGLLFVLFLSIWHFLRTGSTPAEFAEPAADTMPE